jgi:hypothetical protein
MTLSWKCHDAGCATSKRDDARAAVPLRPTSATVWPSPIAA